MQIKDGEFFFIFFIQMKIALHETQQLSYFAPLKKKCCGRPWYRNVSNCKKKWREIINKTARIFN